MKKLKIALLLLTVAIIVVPIGSTIFIYRDNLPGLILPPELQTIVNAGSSNDAFNNSSDLFAAEIIPPTPLGEPKYDLTTGAFDYAVNFTNPLKTAISVDQVSAQLEFKNESGVLCNVSISQPINIAPGASGIINTTGIISQDTLNMLESQYQAGTLDPNNLALKNINVVANGVTLHFDQLDLNSIKSLGGFP